MEGLLEREKEGGEEERVEEGRWRKREGGRGRREGRGREMEEERWRKRDGGREMEEERVEGKGGKEGEKGGREGREDVREMEEGKGEKDEGGGRKSRERNQLHTKSTTPPLLDERYHMFPTQYTESERRTG